MFSGTLKNNSISGIKIDLEIDIGDRSVDMTITHLLVLVQSYPLILNQPYQTCHIACISAISINLYYLSIFKTNAISRTQFVKQNLQGITLMRRK
ncbi:hypothetical protein FNW02_07695 [Komarekiella sp. 'clone 1']|uniref:Uncharacterized protein n=1 Tax=Komarekiella delphini-convector SJRDD-AB1 TaxID=2593771 RepID=A0AA40SVG0_9NOST|nr:hypothetical protein [Komarekiella delphini-convector SJRDD-AB1]